MVPGVLNTSEKIGDIPSKPEKIGDPVADESHEIFVSSSKSDWRGRLHSLALKLQMLENYHELLERYGANDVPDKLDDRFYETFGVSPDDDIVFDAWESVIIQPKRNWGKKFSDLEREVDTFIADIKNTTEYKFFKRAYESNDQRGIAEAAPLVFGVQVDTSFQKRDVFYHGVKIFDLQAPVDDYIDLVLRIQREGLRASPFKVHYVMDDTIQPVYGVNNTEETHGFLFFTFQPRRRGFTIFEYPLGAVSGERFIYTPHIRVPMKLYLKLVFLGRRNVQILTNFLGEEIIDFTMSRDCRGTPRYRIKKDGMISPLAKPITTLAFQMPDEISQLHAEIFIVSRIL